MKALYSGNRVVFSPLAGFFSSEFILLGAEGVERSDWSLVQRETEESLCVSNFAKAKGFIYS